MTGRLLLTLTCTEHFNCLRDNLAHTVVLVQGAVRKLPAPKELSQALYSHFLRLADIGLRIPVAGRHTNESSAEESSSGLTAFVAGDADGDRQLCVRTMAAVYHEHAAAVGELMLMRYDHP